MKSYSLTETAKLIRQALKTTFPKTQFSVRSKSYSGGCSITASWTDGPRRAEVDAILKRFEGAGFDGMTDCKTYNPNSEWNGEACEFAADYVFSSRHESDVLLQIAAYRTHKETKLPLLEVKDGQVLGGNYQVNFTYFPQDDVIASGGEWYEHLVYQIACNISTETAVASPSLPAMVTDDYIAETVNKLLS